MVGNIINETLFGYRYKYDDCEKLINYVEDFQKVSWYFDLMSRIAMPINSNHLKRYFSGSVISQSRPKSRWASLRRHCSRWAATIYTVQKWKEMPFEISRRFSLEFYQILKNVEGISLLNTGILIHWFSQIPFVGYHCLYKHRDNMRKVCENFSLEVQICFSHRLSCNKCRAVDQLRAWQNEKNSTKRDKKNCRSASTLWTTCSGVWRDTSGFQLLQFFIFYLTIFVDVDY